MLRLFSIYKSNARDDRSLYLNNTMCIFELNLSNFDIEMSLCCYCYCNIAIVCYSLCEWCTHLYSTCRLSSRAQHKKVKLFPSAYNAKLYSHGIYFFLLQFQKLRLHRGKRFRFPWLPWSLLIFFLLCFIQLNGAFVDIFYLFDLLAGSLLYCYCSIQAKYFIFNSFIPSVCLCLFHICIRRLLEIVSVLERTASYGGACAKFKSTKDTWMYGDFLCVQSFQSVEL